MERLTVKQMAEKYPDQFLGISNIEHADDGAVAAADVLYNDMPEQELRRMQVAGQGVVCWYTAAQDYIFDGLMQIDMNDKNIYML